MVGAGPAFILGLDLHGTLLEPGEIIRPGLVPLVSAALARLQGRAARFLCTGNDLEFVKRKVPASILAEIDGHVLETGCSVSPDGAREEVITSQAERAAIAGLEALLRAARLPEINYFAHRLTTISMFCDDPRGFYARVDEFTRGTEYYDLVTITYSSVAVDVLPRGYDKHRGLAAAAAGKKTIGVADSMNDAALLAQSDYAFAPANLAPELGPLLAGRGRSVVSLATARALRPGVVMVADQRETEGVIAVLDFLDRKIP
jgi:hydroxymethylpyrimidine pyrophosphatase-like HAD family hydrolase